MPPPPDDGEQSVYFGKLVNAINERSNTDFPTMKFTVTKPGKKKKENQALESDDDGAPEATCVSFQKSALTGFKSKWIKTKAPDKTKIFGNEDEEQLDIMKENDDRRDSDDSFQSCGSGGLGDVLDGTAAKKRKLELKNIKKSLNMMDQIRQAIKEETGTPLWKTCFWCVIVPIVVVGALCFYFRPKDKSTSRSSDTPSSVASITSSIFRNPFGKTVSKEETFLDRVNPMKTTSGKIAAGLGVLGTLGAGYLATRSDPALTAAPDQSEGLLSSTIGKVGAGLAAVCTATGMWFGAKRVMDRDKPRGELESAAGKPSESAQDDNEVKQNAEIQKKLEQLAALQKAGDQAQIKRLEEDLRIAKERLKRLRPKKKLKKFPTLKLGNVTSTYQPTNKRPSRRGIVGRKIKPKRVTSKNAQETLKDVKVVKAWEEFKDLYDAHENGTLGLCSQAKLDKIMTPWRAICKLENFKHAIDLLHCRRAKYPGISNFSPKKWAAFYASLKPTMIDLTI